MATQDMFPDGISHSHVVYLSVTATMTFLSTVAVILRFTSRMLTLSVRWDDWACLGALIVAYGFLICGVILATECHAGYHVWLYSLPTLEKYMQTDLAQEVLYNISVALSKVSMLLFYRRIFTIRKPFRIATWVVAFMIFGYLISADLGLIFAYNPVQAQWKLWIPSTTIDLVPFYVAEGSINIVLDFIILCLPQPLIWKLKLGPQQKLLLSGIFSVGAFVCIASILRLTYLAKMNMDDATYTEAKAGLWTMIEMHMSIICSCLATYPSLFRHFRKDSKSHAMTYGSENTCVRPLNGRHAGPGESETSTLYLKRSTESDQQLVDKVYHGSGYTMDNLGSVHVRTDVNVALDEESQKVSPNNYLFRF